MAPISLPRMRRIAASGRSSMRRPSNRMRPPAMKPGGSSRRMMAAPVSDLPAPDSPTTPSTSPAPIDSEIPSTAVMVPRRVAKATRRSSTSSSFRSAAMPTRHVAVDAQARIDGVIEQIDDEVDEDEEEGDEHEIGRHHRDVGEADRLDDEETHAGPLEDGLGDDGEGDDGAELQPGDGDDRDQRVLEGMAEIDGAVGEAAGARELDVVGAQHLKHLGADEAHDQRHLEEAEGDRRHDQRSEPVGGEKSSRPPADRHGRAAPEGGQPAEDDGEDEDEQDADEKGRQRDADQRDGEEDLRQKGMAVQPGIDAHRDAEEEGEGGGDEAQLERRRQALDDELGNRPCVLIGEPEIPLHGVADEAAELDDEGV